MTRQPDLFPDRADPPPAGPEPDGSAARQHALLLAELRWAGPEGLTDEELSWASWLRPELVRLRRAELVAGGRVADSGRTRATSQGRAAAVWVAGEGG